MSDKKETKRVAFELGKFAHDRVRLFAKRYRLTNGEIIEAILSEAKLEDFEEHFKAIRDSKGSVSTKAFKDVKLRAERGELSDDERLELIAALQKNKE